MDTTCISSDATVGSLNGSLHRAFEEGAGAEDVSRIYRVKAFNNVGTEALNVGMEYPLVALLQNALEESSISPCVGTVDVL